MSKARSIIEFMNIAEGLKRELRHVWLSDGTQERVASHCWSMSLLALLLLAEMEQEIDPLKVLKMIVIHDLVEIYAGDMPAFVAAKGRQAEKEKAEAEALDKLLSKLPNERLASELHDLWHEYEAKQSIESKFAQACDKAEVILQHNLSPIDTFTQGDYDLNPYYKEDYFQFDNFLQEFKRELDRDVMEKFEAEGDMERLGTEHKDRWQQEKQLAGA